MWIYWNTIKPITLAQFMFIKNKTKFISQSSHLWFKKLLRSLQGWNNVKNIKSVYSLKFKPCGKTAGKKTWASFHSNLLYTLLSAWEGKLSSFFPTSWNYILVQKVPWILRVEGNQLTACLNIDVEYWNDKNGNTCFRMLSSLNREFWLILFPFFWHGKVSLNMEEIFATLHEHDFFSQVEQYE